MDLSPPELRAAGIVDPRGVWTYGDRTKSDPCSDENLSPADTLEGGNLLFI
jgi:hypothetical protein